jgi:predicted SprT family Zn-dependent metalloprotease
MDAARNPTRTNYDYYQRAYDHFNAALFEGALPRCLITLQRGRKAYGYFHGGRWAEPGRLEAETDEIALNPAGFAGRSAEDVLATLVHEMARLWQHHQGEKPSSSIDTYHNREWAAKMKEIGL